MFKNLFHSPHYSQFHIFSIAIFLGKYQSSMKVSAKLFTKHLVFQSLIKSAVLSLSFLGSCGELLRISSRQLYMFR